MELFGLPVELRLRSVPLEVSYLTTRVIGPTLNRSKEGEPLENIFASLVNTDDTKRKGGIRLLISGSAGSGKTTASQWIAFSGSQQRLPALASSDDKQLLPLFVRLRDVLSSRTPSDRALLYSGQLRDEVGSNWLENCIKRVTPLVILDGWDELAPNSRTTAHRWLQSLINNYPSAHFVVTSRPEGLSGHEFDNLKFARANIVPLRPQEASKLVKLWFGGLHDLAQARTEFELGNIRIAEAELLEDLHRPVISDMVDTPLLTSMLCCLYAAGHRTTPKKRGQLYDIVVAALIHTRDRDRGVYAGIWDALELDQKEELLSNLAKVMAEYEVLELPITSVQSIDAGHRAVAGSSPQRAQRLRETPTVSEIISDVLPLLGHSAAEAAELTTAMLDRSVVLQRVSQNESRFVHRSFQDYFAARYFRRTQDYEGLLGHVKQTGQWSLLPFACHNAPRRFATAVISWLLLRLDDSMGDDARTGLLNLVECLGAVTTIDEEVRADAEDRVAILFPPRDENEVKTLASLGNSAIGFLGRSRTDPSDYSLAIETLSRIASSDAMDAVAEYATAASEKEKKALICAWRRFDPSTFATKILAKTPGNMDLAVTDEARFNAAVRLESLESLCVRDVDFKSVELSVAKKAERLRRLRVEGCKGIGSLEWTTASAYLRQLVIVKSKGLSKLSALGTPSLWGLQLDRVEIEEIDWVKALSPLRNLRVLWLSELSRPPRVVPIGALINMRNLVTVVLENGVDAESVEFLARNDHLSRVTLGWDLSKEELFILSKCIGLRHLAVRLGQIAVNDVTFAPLVALESLKIANASPALLSELQPLSKLIHLHLHSSYLGRLEDLDVPPQVRKLALSGCILDGFHSRRPKKSRRLSQISELVWRGGELNDLNFLESMPSLRRLDIEDTGSLNSLEELVSVPDGCAIRIVGSPPFHYTPLNRLRDRGCDIVYEPDYSLDVYTDMVVS
jgi:hypothetical protein